MSVTTHINFGFRDLRTSVELQLAPGRPLSVSVFSAGGIKFGGLALSTSAVGAITSTTKLSPSTFTRFRAQIQQRAQFKALGASINASLSAYNNATQLILQGQTALRDLTVFGTASLTPGAVSGAVTSFFNVNDLIQLSGFSPGDITLSASTRAAAASRFAARSTQLTSFAGSISATASNFKLFGATITENFNRQPRPTDDELDAPSTPALARGGAAAEQDTARKTKKELLTRGIKSAIAKPKSWVRDIGTKKEPLRSFKLTPGFNSITNMVFASDNASQPSGAEPLAPFSPVFPFNKSHVTESGHLFEQDDTPGATRVHLYHRSGSNIEMHNDGSVVYKSVGGRYTITHGDDVVKIEGQCQIHVDNDVSVYAKGNVNIQSDKGVNINTAEDFTVHAKNINLRAKRKSTVDGTTIDLRYVKLPGVPVHTPTGMAPQLIAGALKADYPDAATKIAARRAIDRKLNTAYRKRILAKLALPTAVSVAAASRDLLRITEFAQFGSFVPNFKWPSITQPVLLGETPRTNPLSNPLIYSTKSDAANAYRGRLFDTPSEVNNVELYQAHVDTRRTLGEITTIDIAIPGEKTTPMLSRVARATPRPVVYANRDALRGLVISPGVRLGSSSFTLGDIVDVYHSPNEANYINAESILTDAYVDPITGEISLPPDTGCGGGGDCDSVTFSTTDTAHPHYYKLPDGVSIDRTDIYREMRADILASLGFDIDKEDDLVKLGRNCEPNGRFDAEYWIKKAQRPDTLTGGRVVIGWNGYWLARIENEYKTGNCSSADASRCSPKNYIDPQWVNRWPCVTGGSGDCFDVGGTNLSTSGTVGLAPTLVDPSTATSNYVAPGYSSCGDRIVNGWNFINNCSQGCIQGEDGCGTYPDELTCLEQNNCYQ